jgi:small-conductance mechanosensitive channel
MKIVLRLFSAVHGLLALVFVGAAVFLLAAAVHEGWLAWQEGLNGKAAQVVIESIGLAAIAVVSLQIAQTIAEEEILRETHVSGPTRVRRFLSRFLVVVIVALAIEGLIATFKALHEDMDQLFQAATIVAAVGAVLAGWGVFIRLNVPAEKLEPEAMEEAKEEDKKLR